MQSVWLTSCASQVIWCLRFCCPLGAFSLDCMTKRTHVTHNIAGSVGLLAEREGVEGGREEGKKGEVGSMIFRTEIDQSEWL